MRSLKIELPLGFWAFLGLILESETLSGANIGNPTVEMDWANLVAKVYHFYLP